MNYFSLIGLILISYSVLGHPDSCRYSLDGHIFDRDTKEELPFTAVLLLPQNITCIADEHGSFVFHKICAGEHFMVLSHAGCKQDTSRIFLENLNTHKDFYLAHSATNLHEIKVEHLKSEHDPNLMGKHVHQFELITHQANSLASIAENLMGVRNLNSGANIQKPILNGLSGSRLQIVQDGVRLESQQWGQDHAPEWLSSDANGIYVVHGPQTLKMGPDAFGNVLQVEPPSLPTDQQINGGFGLGYASANHRISTKALVSGYFSKKKNVGFSLNGSYQKAGNVKTPKYYQKNTGFREINTSATLHFTLKSIKIILGYKAFIQKTAILSASHTGNLTDLQNAINADMPAEKSGFSYFIDRPFQNIFHQTAFLKTHIPINLKNHLHVQYSYQNNRREEYDKLRGNAASLPANSFYLQTHQISADWDREGKVNEHSLGTQWTIQQNDFGGAYFIPAYKFWQAGLFNIEKWRFKKWELQAGLRYDLRNFLTTQLKASNDTLLNSKFQGISGSLAVYYHYINHGTLSLETGRSWRAPNPVELYSRGLHHGAASIETGNPNLKPETAWYFSLQNYYSGGNRHFIDVQLFYRYYTQYTYLQPIKDLVLTVRGAFPAFEYLQSKAHVFGFNAQYSVQLPAGIFQNLNVQYIRAIQPGSKAEIPFTPPSKIAYTLGWKFTSDRKIKGASASIEAAYTSTQNRIDLSSELKTPPKAFTLLSLNAYIQTAIRSEIYTIAFQLNNILNTRYRDYLNRWRYFTDETGINAQISIYIPITIKP